MVLGIVLITLSALVIPLSYWVNYRWGPGWAASVCFAAVPPAMYGAFLLGSQ